MKIVDINGNPIDTGRLAEPQTARLTHLQREFDRHPARGLTPQRLHAVMVAAEQGDMLGQLDLADDMEEHDAHLYAELDKRRGAVSALEWSIVEPEGASAAEKKLTAALREWVPAIPEFEDLVRGMMDGVLKGFSAHEMVWALDNGLRMPRLHFRPQRWFTVDQATRNVLLLRTSAGPDGEPLQPFSWIAHVHKTRNGYLARGGLARVLAWPYLYKNYSTRDLAEFLEIYGLPLRVGKYPTGATDDEKLTLLQAVTQIGHNAAGIIPQGMLIEFQAAAQGTQAPFGDMMDRMDAAQSKAILGQTLTASEGQHGTQALGNVHNEVRMDIRDSDAQQVQATLTRQLLWPLAQLNFPGAANLRCPRFEFDTGEPEDMQAYADNLPKLVSMGMKIGVDWAQDKLKIPKPADGEELLAAPVPPPAAAPGAPGAPGQPPRPGAPRPAPAPQPRRDDLAGRVPSPPDLPPGPPPDALDALVADALSEWQPVLSPLVEPLLAEIDKAVAAGETPAALLARLPELAALIDGRRLAEQVARAAFVSRLAGEADLDLSGTERLPGD